MPRHARIDIPGLLQHVIVRGIERRDIFLDGDDRHLFVARLVKLLCETGTDCLAWAILSNHFYLLLLGQRCRRTDLAEARAVICYLATRRHGFSGTAVASVLNMTRSGVSVASKRGAVIVKKKPDFLSLFKHTSKPGRVTIAGQPGDDLAPGTLNSILNKRV